MRVVILLELAVDHHSLGCLVLLRACNLSGLVGLRWLLSLENNSSRPGLLSCKVPAQHRYGLALVIKGTGLIARLSDWLKVFLDSDVDS